MSKIIKKITTILMIFLLIGTIGATTASAIGLLDFRNATRYKDLVNKWEEIQNEKQELRDMLEGYGIIIPDLTLKQKREIFRTIFELRREGATREVIIDAVVDLLIDFGFNLPDLTAEQRAEIKTKIKTMLEENYGFVFIELTPEQKAYIKQTVIHLKRQGASREEIKQAIIDLYESYGGVIPELTESEKEEIHNWIVDMLETDYGLDLPNLTLEQREAIKEKRGEIRQLQQELLEMFKDARFFTKIRFIRYVRRNIN